MKKLQILFVTFLFFTMVHAQVNFTAIPQKLQLYARDRQSDTGEVIISGTVNNAGSNYSGMRVKVYRNNSLLKTLDQNLTFNGGSASFTIPYGIKAELAEYKFEALGVNGSSETLLRSADSVVCGDVYIISGQSNAEAHSFNGSASENNSPFIRVLGFSQSNSDITWRIGQGDSGWDTPGNTGQWGLHMARLIIDNHGIPVAIFNGCQSGQPIQFFKRNDVNPGDLSTNYGCMLKRVKAAGLTRNIRAVLWYQGENNCYSDGNAISIAGYKAAYMALVNGWQTDYPGIELFYVAQLRNGCGATIDSAGRIKEAQRELAQPGKIMVMSTSAQNHHTDNCHYPYIGGYKLFGENIYRLLRRDIYGNDAANINAPNIKFAEAGSNGSTITLIMEDILDSLTWASGAQADFIFYGGSPTVNGGSCQRNRVTLTLSGSMNGVTTLSYLGHQNTPDPLVTNLNGVGALHFYKFPLTTPHYRDSASLAAILQANKLNLKVDAVSTSSASGRIVALKLDSLNISVLPRDIGFMDSLKTIDLTGNRLTSLPKEIVALAPTTNLMVDNNHLCSVSDTIKNWINKYAKNTNWQNTQLSDSLHYCNGGLVGTAPWHKSVAAAGSATAFNAEIKGGRMTLRFVDPAKVVAVSVMNLNGATLHRFGGATGALSIDLRDLPKSVVVVRVEWKGCSGDRTDVKRVPLF